MEKLVDRINLNQRLQNKIPVKLKFQKYKIQRNIAKKKNNKKINIVV